jgi:HlyD family secretion protein
MKMSKTLKYLIIATVIIIILIIIGKKSGIVGKKDVLKIATEKVEKRTIIETITASGKIQPKTEVKISADVSGEIIELYVLDGDSIKEGQLLLKINPDIYISTIERLEASVNSSKSQLAQSEAQLLEKKLNFDRNKKLWDTKTISEAEFESYEIAYKIAQANLKSAEYAVQSSQASLKEANENLSKTNIYAPISGIVTKLNVEKGERVVGTAQMTGTEIMRIANLNNMEVIINVNENDIVHVSKNDTTIIEVDAYLNHKFKGIVTEIANSATTDGVSADQVTNFDVKISIIPESYKDLIKPDKPFPLRPGMSASVDIQTETDYNILTIPIQSVTTRADSLLPDSIKSKGTTDLQEIVFVYNNNTVSIKKVKTGIQDDSYIQILEGLKIGDEVVSAPYTAISKKLTNNEKVEKVKVEEAF